MGEGLSSPVHDAGAAFYDGRADALLFASIPSTNLSFLDAGNFFTPSNVDFGKVPRSPAEHALELVKEGLVSGKQLAKCECH